jgi:type VI secretion system protein ImpM
VDVGYYGKLPSHGDFLRRRVSDRFVSAWDGWLQACLAASRAALGERWLDVYLTSPAWRFACGAGACGPRPVIGVMVPSVDRVGRYFPLAIIAELPEDAALIRAAADGEQFLDGAERLAIETLALDAIDVESFEERVITLGYDFAATAGSTRVVLDPSCAAVLESGNSRWQIPIAASSELGSALTQLVSYRLAAMYAPLVLWWTEGSASIEPSCLVARGLPDPESFASLLDGSWAERQWQPVSVHVPVDVAAAEPLVSDVTPPRFRSAAWTHAGRVRNVNQDAFLERPDVGVWAVADGLGGHDDGDVASRMVCDALADFVPDSSFDQVIESARERLQQVNAHLARVATRSQHAVISGSTVVALLVRGSRSAVLWAGDSRVYRYRSGVLEQVTRDHSLAESEGAESTAITRAIGAEPTLTLDLYRDRVRAGDRFLLCSDGLTRAITDEQIGRWMAHSDIRVSVDGLINATLDAGAPDNVTVLVVEAFAASAPAIVDVTRAGVAGAA